MLSNDHYAVLGVAPDADTETIEAAYRHLSRRYHPGLNPGDGRAQAAFERIRLAYEVLTNPEERQRYDLEGRSLADDIEVVGGVHPGGFSGESFGALFRRLCDHARRARPSAGNDLHVAASCRLVDAERGRRTAVSARRLTACAHCGGRGSVRIGETSACGTCRGSGKEVFGSGSLNVAVPCADCTGEGVRSGSPCPMCQASGLVNEDVTVPVQIPPGVLDGQEIRVPAAGHAGRRGGSAGDLVVTVKIPQHPEFRREGPHLHAKLPVSVSEALLGARVPVRSLDGSEAEVRVPPGVHSGQSLRLRGHGLTMADGRRGDLRLEVEVWLPESIDEDTKDLVRAFGERTGAPDRPSKRRATVQP